MVTEYISREAAIKTLKSIAFNHWFECGEYVGEKSMQISVINADKAFEAIEAVPSADVRPVVRKPIVGYDGLYFVTDDGVITNADGKIMKQYTKRGKGTCYKKVALYKDGSYKQKYVHRIVAEAFIPNPDNLPVINHKDEDGTNNRVENLEWCTHQYNANYGTARERQREKLIGKKHTEAHKKKISDSLYRHYDDGFVGRRVVCLETGKMYESVAKAARDLGISESAVRMSCNRSSKSGYKYTFRDFCPNCGADMRKVVEIDQVKESEKA